MRCPLVFWGGKRETYSGKGAVGVRSRLDGYEHSSLKLLIRYHTLLHWLEEEIGSYYAPLAAYCCTLFVKGSNDRRTNRFRSQYLHHPLTSGFPLFLEGTSSERRLLPLLQLLWTPSELIRKQQASYFPSLAPIDQLRYVRGNLPPFRCKLLQGLFRHTVSYSRAMMLSWGPSTHSLVLAPLNRLLLFLVPSTAFRFRPSSVPGFYVITTCTPS